jgi:hypothetical protein
MMLVSAETLQTIRTAHDARLLNDKALRELVKSDAVPKYQVRLEVAGVDQTADADEELPAQPFTFDLNVDRLAKWAASIQKSYGKDAMIDLRLLRSGDRLRCKIDTSEIEFSRKGFHLGDPFKLELENDQLVLREKIDRAAMKETRAVNARANKIERLRKKVLKCERAVDDVQDSIVRHAERVNTANSLIAATPYDQALNEPRLIHTHRRKLNTIRRIIDPTDENYSHRSTGSGALYHELLSHEAPEELLTWPNFLWLADAIVSHTGDYCKCSDDACIFEHHAPYTAIEYGINYWRAGYARYEEKRKKLHGIRMTSYRLGAGQQKKIDEFKRAISDLVRTAETIYRNALERRHGKEIADRVLWSQRGSDYNEARALLRRAPRERLTFDMEREAAIIDLETANTELELVMRNQ